MTVEQEVAVGTWPPDIGVDWDYLDDQRVIMHVDCRGILPALATGSVDLVVTDPPYGMSFMGKDWDKVLPDPAIWRECLRVLKPGAFAFVMSSPRADLLSRMIASLEGAGFNVGFTPIYWAYACLSADTEVLTRDGWKDWEQLRTSTIRDKIVVYDTEAEVFQFESPSAWHAYRVREDLLRIESQDTEQLVTRNHRVLTPLGMVYADHLEDEASVVYLPRVPAHIRCVPGRGSQETRECGAVLLKQLSAKGDDSGTDSRWQARSLDVRTTETAAARGHDGREESGLEGWRHVFQDTRELRCGQVCQVPTGVSGDGSQGRLRDGAPSVGGAVSGETAVADGGRPSQEPRSNGQQSGRDALQRQPRAQAVRGGSSYRTTVAGVHRQWYDGIVYCPTVSTGCFVARRNGKMFLTGNSGFPKAQNIGKAVDKRLGVERPETGERVMMHTPTPGGTFDDDGYDWGAKYKAVTGAGSLQAQSLDGSYAGFQPKPAVEVIIVAMKPLSEKTYVDQALANGHGVTWMDAGRIPYQSDGDKGKREHHGAVYAGVAEGYKRLNKSSYTHKTDWESQPGGRFPANLLCSDDVLDDGIEGKATKPHPIVSSGTTDDGYGNITERRGEVGNYGDGGSFSRYFDLDAWWAERLKSLPESVQRTFPFLEVTKASKREKGNSNNHPTVKPVKLMSYLIELGSRPGDVVLDPFVGSGTTLLSAGASGRYSIGVERDEIAYAIAVNRCAADAVDRIRRGEY